MEKESEEEKSFNSLIKRLNDLWYSHEIQSPTILCCADSLQFDHAHPDFKNLKKLQNQLKIFLMSKS